MNCVQRAHVQFSAEYSSQSIYNYVLFLKLVGFTETHSKHLSSSSDRQTRIRGSSHVLVSISNTCATKSSLFLRLTWNKWLLLLLKPHTNVHSEMLIQEMPNLLNFKFTKFVFHLLLQKLWNQKVHHNVSMQCFIVFSKPKLWHDQRYIIILVGV
jgi:hypothetical protein